MGTVTINDIPTDSHVTPSPIRSAEQMSSTLNSKPSEQPLPDPYPTPGEAKVNCLRRSLAFLFWVRHPPLLAL